MNTTTARTGRWANHPAPVTINCIVCATPFTVRFSRSKTAKYCNYRCHQIGEGRKGGTVRGEQVKEKSEGKAYTKIKGRHSHRVIMERKLGRALLPGEIVHHIDENILNNDPSNLELMPSQKEHMTRHRTEMLASRKAKHGY